MVTLIGGDLYQWDTGRTVFIAPDSGYAVHEVHFTTKKMDYAYVVKTYVENGGTYCAIPNILLQQYQDVICYEVRENDAGEESISTTTFDVIKRNRPVDYVYTEPEKYTYKELENRVKILEDNLEDLKVSVNEAAVLANNAYEIAESANSAAAADATSKDEALETKITDAYKAYADGEDEKIESRVGTLEGASHTHTNKTELDLIVTGDKAKWDDAAGKAHTHENKDVLDGITAGKVSNWDSAEANAKTYADLQKPSATDLIGTVSIQNGGTGVSSEADFKILITSTAYQIGGGEPTSGPILWFDTATA